MIAAGEEVTFAVQLDAGSEGSFNATLSFASDDSDENPFDFSIAGTVATPPASQIIDNGDAGYSQTGWTTFTPGNAGAYQSDAAYTEAGASSSVASWTFTVTPGEYLVSASWVAFTNRSSDTTYTILDGAGTVATAVVDQRQAPGDRTEGGAGFGDLGTVTITGTSLVVELTGAGNGYTIADAVRVERVGDLPSPAAELQVLDGARDIVDGSGSVSFGSTVPGSPVSKIFTVKNVGSLDLTVQPVVLGGSGFTITSNLGADTVIAAGEEVTFAVQLDAGSEGSFNATLSFASDDSDENPFDFSIAGTVATPPASQIIDNGDAGYSQTGWTTFTPGNAGAYQSDAAYTEAGASSSVASWTFTVTPGEYLVSASWVAFTNRSSDTTYTILDGAGTVATAVVDQRQAPGDRTEGGAGFGDLGTVTITGTSLVVELTGAGNGYTIADAVRVERVGDLPSPAAELQVLDGARDIVDGSGSVSFGSTVPGSPVSKIFTVKNVGSLDLTVQPVVLGGSGFTITSNLGADTVIAAGEEVTFAVQLDAGSEGSFNATLSFASDDSDENPFDFSIAGTVATPPASQIIDNGDAGYSQTGWTTFTPGNAGAYQSDAAYTEAGASSSVASWTFTVTPGEYLVSASWVAFTNRSSDTTYTILDGAGTVATAVVDQRQAPGDRTEGGAGFGDLGTVTITGTSLVVELTGAGNGYTIADAVRVERVGDLPSPAAELQVLDGARDIVDGSGSVSFGSTVPGSPVSKIFTVKNVGSLDLTVQPVVLGGSGFTITSNLGADTVIAAGEEVTFAVQLDAGSEGSFNATLSFASDDSDENPFDFSIAGTVATPPASQIIDNGDAGYSQTGWTTFTPGNAGAYQSDAAYTEAGASSSVASWTFTVTPGEYLVSASWVAFTNRSSDTTYTILDGAGTVATAVVDQRQAPGDRTEGGAGFGDLGTVTITGTSLVVELTGAGNGYTIADAVRIELITPALTAANPQQSSLTESSAITSNNSYQLASGGLGQRGS